MITENIDTLLNAMSSEKEYKNSIKERLDLEDDFFEKVFREAVVLDLIDEFNYNTPGPGGFYSASNYIEPSYRLSEKGLLIKSRGGYSKFIADQQRREQELEELNATNLEIARQTRDTMNSNRRITFIGGLTGLIGGLSGLIALYLQLFSLNEPKQGEHFPMNEMIQPDSLKVANTIDTIKSQ